MDEAARFWAKVDKQAPNGCWEWTGSRLPKGYGQFAPNHRPVRAHRYSYELHHGTVPAGLMVLHRCDNPPCVNPAHLYAGTRLDNARDAVMRDRTAQRLNVTARAIVRRMRANGATQAEVARCLGIGQAAVSRYERGKTFGGIGL